MFIQVLLTTKNNLHTQTQMEKDLLTALMQIKNYRKTTYKKNEIIFQNKRFEEKFYLVKNGSIKITYLSEEGEETIPMLLTKNQVFGLDFIYGNFYSNFSYMSICNTTVIYEFDLKDIYQITNGTKNSYKILLPLLKDEYAEIEKRIKTLQIRSAKHRLISVLMELKHKFEQPSSSSDSTIINSPFNQDELATYTRTSRVTTNNFINELKSKALIDYRKRNITLKKGFFDYCRNTIQLE